MERIPTLAWAAIGVIVLITIVINIILIAMLIAKNPARLAQRPPRGFTGTAQKLATSGEVLRDPFAKERGQLSELARLVQALEKPAPTPPGEDVPRQDDEP